MNIIKVTINNEAKEWVQEFTLTAGKRFGFIVTETNTGPDLKDYERIPTQLAFDTIEKGEACLADMVRQRADQLFRS
mgnify:CR=1 FL=1|tara:strand:+ start:200 stop:430 length:231 start_codon:yes stop_codon:yes gene_type:complete